MRGWKEVSIDEISDYVTVGYVGSMASEYIDEGVLFLRSQNIEPFKLNLAENQVRYISDKFHKKLSKSKLISGDIAMVRTGYPGTCCVIPEGMGELNCSDLVIIRPEFDLVDSHFLCYFLNSPLGKASISGNLVGAAQQHFNVGVAKKIKLNLPNLHTQQKIASILSAYDDLIENNNQRIKLLEEMAEEIYKEWFVRLRFPGYQDCKYFDKDGKEVPQGTVGALPEGWEIKKFRDCLSHYIGGGWGEDEPTGKFIKPAHVIRGTDLPDFKIGKLNYDVLRFHTKSNLSSRKCKPNDIIFEVSGGTESQSLGRTVFITQKALDRFKDPVIAASFCKLIRVNSKVISSYYINQTLLRMHQTGELKVFQVQSTGLSNYQFEDFIEATKVNIPPNEVQQGFEGILKPMYEEIQTLGEKNQILQETRDLLLPRLISGKLSVEDLEMKNESLPLAAEPTSNYTT
ncbi:MAG TPA: restriction endonuclease subunit S [Chitinophagales bacterium]|nr:restriction endonuclease subunit S [Chitinophagales bacterium]